MKNSAKIAFPGHKLDEDIHPMWASSYFFFPAEKIMKLLASMSSLEVEGSIFLVRTNCRPSSFRAICV
jgi:hypothetical protein